MASPRGPSEQPSRADPARSSPREPGRPAAFQWPTRDGMWQVETTKMSFSQDDVLKAALSGNEAKLREMIAADPPTVLAARSNVRAWAEGAS